MNTHASEQDPTSVAGRRVVSYLIDVVVMILIVPGLVFLATADLTMYTDGPSCAALDDAGMLGAGTTCDEPELGPGTGDTVVYRTIAVLLAMLLAFAYAVGAMLIWQGLRGQTLGRLLSGTRTVDANGQPPGVGRQLLRCVGGVADLFPWGCLGPVPLVGLVTMLITRGHRRLGDMTGSTYVVGTADAGRPVLVPGASAVAQSPPQQVAGGPSQFSPGPPPHATQQAHPTQQAYATQQANGSHAAAPPPAAPGTRPSDPTRPTAEPFPVAARQTQVAAPGVVPGQLRHSDPQWDPQRGAWVVWDESTGRWLAYHDASGQWMPLT